MRSHRLAVLLAILAVSSLAKGDPTDTFSTALPGRDTAAPEGQAGGSGSAGVTESQGSASYSHPIVVPAGRNGMAPSLALSYSSSGALRGGIAVGWSLELP